MPTWNSRGLRGSTLEEFINRTNERYRENHLALIQKVPTPITPIKMDKESRHITLAYFEQKSTVDYIGVVQGIPVCFDAKECQVNTFPLQNIHPHQVEFIPILTGFIICHFGNWHSSGSGCNRAAERVFVWMNWMRRSFLPVTPDFWCHIWMRFSWI